MLFSFKYYKNDPNARSCPAPVMLRFKPWVFGLCNLGSVSYRKAMEESLEAVTCVLITVENFVKVRFLAFDVCL